MKHWRKKLPKKQAPTKTWDEDQMKIVGWCMNKNIHIGVTPDFEHDYNFLANRDTYKRYITLRSKKI